ncbi:MAG: hypothetical protein KKH61_20415 [Gammaproteobacteria bacterium]|nr:hypothetical protein [Gammaproteobacteria bacterium]
MADYTEKQMAYIHSVGGAAHQSAVDIIGGLEAENDRLRACLKDVPAASVMTSNLYGDARVMRMAAIVKNGLNPQEKIVT